MLIPSGRHTFFDLECWADYESADELHGRRFLESSKLARSVTEIRKFTDLGTAHICFSGGKDSACVIGIAEAAGVLDRLAVVWYRAVPKYSPEVPETIEMIERRFGIKVVTIDYESPVPGPITHAEAEIQASGNFLAACRDYERSRESRRILGVRADESHVRKMKMLSLGLSSKNSCTPIGWWNLQDVYGYIAIRGIPIHPAYGMTGGGRWPRMRLRIDALMGENGRASGRGDWEREYYGDVLDRLEAASMREQT